MVTGIININKGKGMTSHDCVNIARKVFDQRKVAHTGTLDPDVTGVLPLCLGRATKLASYISGQGKAYQGEFVTGYRTDSLDASGTVTARSDQPIPSLEEVQAQSKSFLGEIDQVPPMYSAVKHHGKRLYQLAREGKEVDRKARKVFIKDFQVFDLKDGVFRFSCTCSKGTYVRALVDDLGEGLGCLATMTQLTRVRVGPYLLGQALPIARLKEMSRDEALDYVQAMETGVMHLDALRVSQPAGLRLFYGQDIDPVEGSLYSSDLDSDLSRFSMKGEEPPKRLYVEDLFAGLVQDKEGKLHLRRGLVDIEKIKKLNEVKDEDH